MGHHEQFMKILLQFIKHDRQTGLHIINFFNKFVDL